MAVWSPRDEHVRFYSLEGRSVRQVRSPGAPTEVTLEGVENYLRLMARLELGPGSDSIDFRRRARDLKPAFGPRGPAFADLRCGSGAAVWLQRFDLQEHPLGRGPEWVRVAEGGEPEAVRVPHEFKPFVFDDERVVGVVESAEGDLLASWRRSLVEVS